MKFPQHHILPTKVQFEDIDMNGVVHHPNYLKYLERGRYHAMKESGYSFEDMIYSGATLAVSSINANYLRPAFLDQEVYIISKITSVGKACIQLYQSITTNLPKVELLEQLSKESSILPNTIFWAEVKLVYIDLKLVRPKSIPQELKQLLKGELN